MIRPTPLQCQNAAKALRVAAKQEREEFEDSDRAALLDTAAEIMESKALVGTLAEVVGLNRRKRK